MKKKLLVTAMAAMPMLGMFGGNFASAKVDSDKTVTTNAIEDVTVKVTQSSTFSVVIPKVITLEEVTTSTNSEYKEDYTVVVKGNIAGNEEVVVGPAVTTFDLNQSGKDPLSAKVTQDEVSADYDDLKDDAEKDLPGTVEVSGVTAGSWQGTFDFNIAKLNVTP